MSAGYGRYRVRYQEGQEWTVVFRGDSKTRAEAVAKVYSEAGWLVELEDLG